MRRWKLRKYVAIGPGGLSALGLIALATVLRFALIPNWPILNSDEGTMGLMAQHIVDQGKIPIFFYGQGYMGSLEAMLAAPFFRLFGPSNFTLRLGLLVFYALFMLNMYLLTTILYTRLLALVVLVLLCFGSSVLLSLQLSAIGGYPDMLFFASLLLLYALVLARSAGDAPLARERRARLLAYAGWGLAAGLALWTDPLLIPYMLLSGWLLWRFCRREMRRAVIFWVIGCFLLPLLPGILYNFTVPLTQGTLTFLGAAFWLKGSTVEFAPPLTRIIGTLFVALPRATGGTGLCSFPAQSDWPLFTGQNASDTPCVIVYGLWGTGFLILLLLTAAMAYKGYRALHHTERLRGWTLKERQQAASYGAQLALVGSPLLILIVYANTSPAGSDPWSSTRYLTCTLIALPAALWPIWQAWINRKRTWLAKGRKALAAALFFIILLSFTLGWVQTLSLIPLGQRAQQQETDLIDTLLHRGITHIYTDYWTCDRIAFESRERIICSVLDDQLQPGTNRYTPYSAIVTADPHASWVFPIGSPQAQAFEQNMQKTRKTIPSFTRDGYIIYTPAPSTTGASYMSFALLPRLFGFGGIGRRSDDLPYDDTMRYTCNNMQLGCFSPPESMEKVAGWERTPPRRTASSEKGVGCSCPHERVITFVWVQSHF